jgi:hypothetical protein
MHPEVGGERARSRELVPRPEAAALHLVDDRTRNPQIDRLSRAPALRRDV